MSKIDLPSDFRELENLRSVVWAKDAVIAGLKEEIKRLKQENDDLRADLIEHLNGD